MKILLIHQNFPGQFKHLFQHLRTDPRITDMRAFAMRDVAPEDRGTVIDCRQYLQTPPASWPLIDDLAAKTARGMAVSRACDALKRAGFVPDVILGHPGWGEMVFIRDCFPDARIICFFEFYYRTQGLDFGFDPEFPATQEQAWGVTLKNAMNHFALEMCDTGISPTAWQRQTYPAQWHDKIKVLHDGVDTALFAPDPNAALQIADQALTRGDGLVTFTARSLEPYRGFHSVMRALPRILKDAPHARVVFLGGDGVSYGTKAPGGRNWRPYLQQQLGDAVDWSRVYFLGKQPYPIYRRVLQASTVHLHFNYPFVLPWSLLDAMACECAIVASDTGPVQDVISHDAQGLLVDIFDPEAIAAATVRLVASDTDRARLGRAARQWAVQERDLHSICLPQQMDLLLGSAPPQAVRTMGQVQRFKTGQRPTHAARI